MSLIRVLRLFAVLTLMQFMPSLACAASDPAEPELQLRIGDVLAVTLPGEAALTKDFVIDRQGKILLPEVGSVALSGKSLAESVAAIRDKLSHAYRDLERLTVVLKDRRLFVSVHGYVKTPGPVELTGDATVQMAIAAAGGLAQGAQLDRLQVRHADGTVETFDYKKYLSTGNLKDTVALRPLDTVFVPASPLTGNVQIDFDSKTLASNGYSAPR